MRWTFPLIVSLLCFSITAIVACGPAPQSDELQQLEGNLRSQDAQRLREIPNAARYFDEARQYRRVSEEARDDRREDRSREYALLGLMRYQTAEAIYEQFQVADRLREVNAQIEELNPEIRSVTQSRNELAADLRSLDQEIQQAVREREQRRRAARETASSEFAAAGSDDDTTDREVLDEANEKISRAEELREKALENKADEYTRTRGMMGRAETQLENARTILQESPGAASTAVRQIGFAIQLFEEAYELAKPIHEEMVEKMRPENRIATLLDRSRANYSARFVEEEQNGVRVILARLFMSGESDFHHGTGPMLNTLSDLAEEYEEFSIDIEGYTQQSGGATQNLTISQSRAHKVEQQLLDAGIDADRINTEGFGQNRIRYTESIANNDRVEVIFRHTAP